MDRQYSKVNSDELNAILTHAMEIHSIVCVMVHGDNVAWLVKTLTERFPFATVGALPLAGDLALTYRKRMLADHDNEVLKRHGHGLVHIEDLIFVAPLETHATEGINPNVTFVALS